MSATLKARIAASIPAELRVLNGRHTLPEPKSNGYHASFKVTDDNGQRYQVSAAGWVVKSKESGEPATADTEDVVAALELVTEHVTPKVFSSKKAGFYGQTKMLVGSNRLQLSVSAVAIG